MPSAPPAIWGRERLPLLVHGVLHLLEYNHEEPEETAAMQRRERELLARFAEVERFTPDDEGAT